MFISVFSNKINKVYNLLVEEFCRWGTRIYQTPNPKRMPNDVDKINTPHQGIISKPRSEKKRGGGLL